MQTLDAFQQTLDAVMKKTGDLNDVEDEAEKLLETMHGHNAALTKILLESPANDLSLEQVGGQVEEGVQAGLPVGEDPPEDRPGHLGLENL